MLKIQLEEIKKELLKEIENASSSKEVELIELKFLGKKGLITSLMPLLKSVKDDERPLLGKSINDLKNLAENLCKKKLSAFASSEMEKRLSSEWLDVTLPGSSSFIGRKHPITELLHKMVSISKEMGFSVEIGPELDTDYYNFEALHFPKEHPARDMQDTFYISSTHLLRTHTSNIQVRLLEKQPPPIRAVMPGRVFRNENVSARSHVFFHQLEGMYVDTKVSFADLFATLDEFYFRLFGKKVATRYRPSFFPFVEPGMEGDIACTNCSGKGCHLCKHTGWLEVVGAGMIHPEVLKAGGLDPKKYLGFAWGMGIERLAMLLYNLSDIRLFWQNDLRLLEQF